MYDVFMKVRSFFFIYIYICMGVYIYIYVYMDIAMQF